MSEIPDDIFQTACGIAMEAKSLKSMLKHKDVINAIAAALLYERERCALIALAIIPEGGASVIDHRRDHAHRIADAIRTQRN